MIRDVTVRRFRGGIRSIRTSEGEDDQLADPRVAAVAGILVVLFPLVPFFAVVWMISKTLEGVRRRVSWE